MKNWKNIRLELARTEEFPTGSVGRCYLIRLPLDDKQVIDEQALALNPHRATVRRYWSTEPDEVGQLEPVASGWAIRCNGNPDRLVAIEGRTLRLGLRVSVIEPNGAILPFRIASIG